MKLYAQGLARRMHEQRIGMTEEQMMHGLGGNGAAEPPKSPVSGDPLQKATPCYNSADAPGRNGNGNCSRYDKSSGNDGPDAPLHPRAGRLMENRIDGSAEDIESINPKLKFEARVAQKVKSLSPAQENAIELLVRGHSDQSAANHCGLHRVTLTRWRLYNPGFRAELSRRRQETWSHAADDFRQLLHRAVEVMRKHLDDPDPTLRFRAARSILAMAPKFRPPDEPIDVEGVLTAEARKLNVQFHELHPADCIVYEDERQRALNHLMQRAGEDFTDGAASPSPAPCAEAAGAAASPSHCTQGEGRREGSADVTRAAENLQESEIEQESDIEHADAPESFEQRGLITNLGEEEEPSPQPSPGVPGEGVREEALPPAPGEGARDAATPAGGVTARDLAGNEYPARSPRSNSGGGS